LTLLQYPVLVTPKIDGFRAYGGSDGMLRSRTGRLFPNEHLNKLFHHSALSYLDGELVVGAPHGGDVIRRTSSGVMRKEGEPDAHLYVFDLIHDSHPHNRRLLLAADRVRNMPPRIGPRVHFLVPTVCETISDVLKAEECFTAQGYEGAMVRSVSGVYKFGRATAREGIIFKLKRFSDAEAVVIDLEEGAINDNVQTRKPDGAAQRSTAKEGKRAGATVGTIIAKTIDGKRLIRVSPGALTHTERRNMWLHKERYVGALFTFKYFPHGTVEAPRHPTFKAWREGD
jgi:DNA ligase-1